MKGMNRRQRRNVRFGRNVRRSNVRQRGISRRRFLGTAAAGVGAAAMAGAGVVRAGDGSELNPWIVDNRPGMPHDFTTIQDAVDAASAGDFIQIAPGYYKGAIIPGNNPNPLTGLKIIGSGPGTIIDKPDPVNGGISIYGSDSNNPTGVNVDGIEIKNLTIDGSTFSGTYPSGVYGFDVDNVKVNNLHLKNTRVSVWLRVCNDCEVSNNTCEHRNSWDLGPIWLHASKRTTVHQNVCSGASQYGIVLSYAAQYNTVSENDFSGLTVKYEQLRMGHSIVSQNEFTDNVFGPTGLGGYPYTYGIRCWGNNNTFTGNTFEPARWVIRFYGDGNTFDGNTVGHSSWGGLVISGDGNTFGGNTLLGSGNFGVWCSGPGNTFTGNELNGTYGMSAAYLTSTASSNYFGPDDVLPGNTFGPLASNNALGVFVVQGDYNTIQHNDFTQCNNIGTVPGWIFDEVSGEFTSLGCILLEGDNNEVMEHPQLGTKYFPTGTTMCDQIFDLGANNYIHNWDNLCSDYTHPPQHILDKIWEKWSIKSCAAEGGTWMGDHCEYPPEPLEEFPEE